MAIVPDGRLAACHRAVDLAMYASSRVILGGYRSRPPSASSRGQYAPTTSSTRLAERWRCR